MDHLFATDIRSYPGLSTAELRSAFLVGDLFQPGKLVLRHWETDRTVLGGAVPTQGALPLGSQPELVSAFFCERREAGIINIGSAGSVVVDGVRHALGPLDGLYVGRGAKDVVFASDNPADPAQFYLLSYPAHAAHPTSFIARAGVAGTDLGAPETANARTLYKYIHTGGVRSCQLVMGLTVLKTGGVWNTMPPHTHLRRSEVYLYFKVPAHAAVFHFMGTPAETRHLVVRSGEAVLSPPWSIHTGVGTANYTFIWGMGGENQEFSDMDPAPVDTLF